MSTVFTSQLYAFKFYMYSFNMHLLSISYVPSTILSTGDPKVNTTRERVQVFGRLTLWEQLPVYFSDPDHWPGAQASSMSTAFM